LQKDLGRQLQHAEHVRETLQLAGELRGQLRVLVVLGAIDLGGEGLQRGQCFGRVEILVHRRFELRRRFAALPLLRNFDVAQRHIQAAERRVRLFDLHQRIIDRAAVVAGDEEEPQHFRIAHVAGLQHVADAEEVAQRFGHLLVVHVDEAVVHPVFREAVAAGRAGLRDLVFMVREFQVRAAAVNVEARAEDVVGHGRALDVPARPSFAPR
jgi:hypothetical protein